MKNKLNGVSNVMSEQLEVENANLKKQLENNTAGIENLLAQLDAHKQMVNEAYAINLQLRTNIVLFQKQNTKLTDQIKTLEAEIERLKANPAPVNQVEAA